MAKPSENLAQDIFFEAPPAPRRGKKFFVALAIAVVLLAWSFHGAKIRLGELLEGIPQIGQTLARMLPPDFSKITDAKHYYLPENLSWGELLLPAPLAEADARVRQRWWDNTFPQTVLGATLRITRNGRIEVSREGEELILKLPARGRAIARGTGALTRLVRKTARGDFTVTIRARLDVTPAGAFTLRLSSAHAWDVPAQTTVLGRRIDLRRPVDRLLRKGLDKVEGRVRRIVEDQSRLGVLLQGTLLGLQEPVRVGRDPEVWLTVAPKALHFTGVMAEGARVLAPVTVEAELRSHVGSRPEYEPAQALPVIDGRQSENQDFVVSLPVILNRPTPSLRFYPMPFASP